MKTALIRTPWEPMHLGFKKIASFEPLQLEYLATAIAELSDVTLWDLWYENESDMIKEFEKEPPDLVAISVATVHIYSTRRIAEKIKRINPKVVVLVGGEAFLFPGYFTKSSIDLIAVGTGGAIIREIIQRIISNSGIEGIPGTICLKDGKESYSPILKPVTLDQFGLPNRNLNKIYRNKFHMYHYKPLASMVMSQGCWNRCNFCSTWLKNGTGCYTPRPLDIALKDVSSIEEPWVFLVDDDTFGEGNNISEFVDEIDRSNIKKQFMIEATSDDIVKNSRTIAKWAANGLRHVLIGLESPFEDDLRSVSKAASLAQNIKAIEILQQNGVDIIASFILFPHWEKSHFNAIWEFVNKHNLFFVHYQCLTPMPGTRLFIDSFKDIEQHNLDLYDMEHMVMKTKMPLKRWYNERFWLNVKTFMFHRGFNRQVKRSLPLNPFHFIHRATIYLHWSFIGSHKHHRVAAPEWQLLNPDRIMGCGPILDLLQYHNTTTNKEEGTTNER